MSESSVELHPCPLCGASLGYELRPGETFRWFDVMCSGCKENVAESRRGKHPMEGRNPAADVAWNKAASYAAELLAECQRLRAEIAARDADPSYAIACSTIRELRGTLASFRPNAERYLWVKSKGKPAVEYLVMCPVDRWDESIDMARGADGVSCQSRDQSCLAEPTELAMARFVEDLSKWSLDTFGPGPRAAAILDHLGKELAEIEASPGSVEEWIDVTMLALDGAVRSGASARQVVAALVTKLRVNHSRSWPDWRTAPPGRAIEHIRREVGAAPEGGRDAQR